MINDNKVCEYCVYTEHDDLYDADDHVCKNKSPAWLNKKAADYCNENELIFLGLSKDGERFKAYDPNNASDSYEFTLYNCKSELYA